MRGVRPVILTKEEFCKVIDQLQKAWDAESQIDKIARDLGSDFLSVDLTYLGGPLTTVLDKMFNSETEDVYYFCYELNFGREYKPGSVKDPDGTDVDFSTAEKLYDYLIKHMEDGEQQSESTDGK